MTAPSETARPQDVLDFWFGTLDADGRADETHEQRWFRQDPAFDEEIRRRFLPLHQSISRGENEDWPRTKEGRLAYVIVLDQFSRNMFRGRPDMFAQDARALEAALEGLQGGEDTDLPFAQRGFLYMPLMHSEDPAMQDRCVELFAAWQDATEGSARATVARQLDFAKRHRDIVARFGRFPHRNSILERTTTADEAAFLQQPGSGF